AAALAGLLRREERLDHAAEVLRRYAGARIGHCQHHIFAGRDVRILGHRAGVEHGVRSLDRQLAPAGIASRALIARLTKADSSCVASVSVGHRLAAPIVSTSIFSPSVRRNRADMTETRSLRSMAADCSGCLRANARSLRVSLAPRRLAESAEWTSSR